MSEMVSMGMPVYNGGCYIREAIEGLLGQSYENFELIISDNGSTDETMDICEEYARSDSRIRVYHNEENVGAAANYNRVFALSRGKYFKWAAHDDICRAGFLERCLEGFASEGEETVLCYPETVTIDAAGSEQGVYDGNIKVCQPSADGRLGYLLRNLKQCNMVHGLIRSEALRRTELIGNYFASDVVLLSELVLQGKVRRVGGNLFLRRMHPGMSRRAHKSWEEVAKWFDPANKGKVVLPLCNLTVQIMRAIERSGLGAAEKAACWVVVAEDWCGRYWRQMGGEAKTLARTAMARVRRRERKFDGVAAVYEGKSVSCT